MNSLMDQDDRSEIAFFDVETTVPSEGQPYRAILEFGSILVCPKKLTELRSYTTLVQPSDLSLISSLSVRPNGINRDVIVSAPLFSEIADDVYDILHGRIWAGHNILSFDCARIREAFAEIGRQPPEPKGAIDSLTLLSERFGRRAGDMKMATLAAYFGLGKQTHRSLDDVRMNLEVVKYCATVLFLESSLEASSSREGDTLLTSLRLPSIGENSEVQPDPLKMSHLSNEMDSDNNLMDEDQIQPSNIVVSDDTNERFLAPDEISLPNIKAILVPLYHGSPIMKLKILHGDAPLQLYCSCLKIRFGISGKFLDNVGRRRLYFVVDLNPSLCKVLEACDSNAQRLSVESGSSSDWNSVLNPMKGFLNCPSARIHIQTEVNGDVTRYATEIHQREPSRASLIYNNPSAELLESFLNPGTVLDAFLTLEPYVFQQKAGIRLVAKKLVIH